MARRNVLSITPDMATKQPMVSDKTGKRWQMVMNPAAIREILMDKLGNHPISDVTKNLLNLSPIVTATSTRAAKLQEVHSAITQQSANLYRCGSRGNRADIGLINVSGWI